jgi:hypothetical protein
MNMRDMYAVSTSGITKRIIAGLVSFPARSFDDTLMAALEGAAPSSSRRVLVRDQIASLHLGGVGPSSSEGTGRLNSGRFPRLNSRRNSKRDSARSGGGSSSMGEKSDEERGGGGM